jgi:hypothetical protein
MTSVRLLAAFDYLSRPIFTVRVVPEIGAGKIDRNV